jgi:hypothetical protein
MEEGLGEKGSLCVCARMTGALGPKRGDTGLLRHMHCTLVMHSVSLEPWLSPYSRATEGGRKGRAREQSYRVGATVVGKHVYDLSSKISKGPEGRPEQRSPLVEVVG